MSEQVTRGSDSGYIKCPPNGVLKKRWLDKYGRMVKPVTSNDEKGASS